MGTEGEEERRTEGQYDDIKGGQEDRRTRELEDQMKGLVDRDGEADAVFGCLVASVITLMNAAVLTAQIQI